MDAADPDGNGARVADISGIRGEDEIPDDRFLLPPPGEQASYAAAGADYVVLLAHLGSDEECRPWTYEDVISGTSGIDALLVGGEPLDPGKTYRLASHNFMLLNGGDGYSMVKDCKVLVRDGKEDYQTLIDYITDTLGGVIGPGYEDPAGQGRIVRVNGGQP